MTVDVKYDFEPFEDTPHDECGPFYDRFISEDAAHAWINNINQDRLRAGLEQYYVVSIKEVHPNSMPDDTIGYGFDVGDVVYHEKDIHGVSGIVTNIDYDNDLGGVTTCNVVWGATSWVDAINTPRTDQDIQWTNKLVRCE